MPFRLANRNNANLIAALDKGHMKKTKTKLTEADEIDAFLTKVFAIVDDLDRTDIAESRHAPVE